MDRILKLSIVVFVLFSCEKQFKKEEKNNAPKVEQVSVIKAESDPEPEFQETEETLFKSLLPSTYRDWDNKNEVDQLTPNWVAVNEIDGQYFLQRSDFKVERGFSECVGDSTKTIIPNDKTLIFLESNALKPGKINTIAITRKKIWPNEKYTFVFNSVSYTLRATGDVKKTENVYTDDGLEVFKVVENYRLYLSENGMNEQPILHENGFNDTFVELKLIGDIDRDGKPDLVFRTDRDYEENRMLIFLSGSALKGKIIKKATEAVVQFDC